MKARPLYARGITGPATSGRTQRRRPRFPTKTSAEPSRLVDAFGDFSVHHETSPRLTGGDVDADWQNAWACGDEAVGGSTATPDQDVVDELGEALGVAQAPDAELRTTGEILAERDRHRWRLELEAADEDTIRPDRQP
jgi:Family of unknown function (DUF6335)